MVRLWRCTRRRMLGWPKPRKQSRVDIGRGHRIRIGRGQWKRWRSGCRARGRRTAAQCRGGHQSTHQRRVGSRAAGNGWRCEDDRAGLARDLRPGASDRRRRHPYRRVMRSWPRRRSADLGPVDGQLAPSWRAVARTVRQPCFATLESSRGLRTGVYEDPPNALTLRDVGP